MPNAYVKWYIVGQCTAYLSQKNKVNWCMDCYKIMASIAKLRKMRY